METTDDTVDVWMPFYPGDYLKKTRHLSCEEHGAYFQLIVTLWCSKGSICFEPARLARTVGLDPARWESVWSGIQSFFVVTPDGRLTHKKVSAVLQQAVRLKSARRQSGRLGGKASAETRRSKRTAELAANAQANGQQTSSNGPSKTEAPPVANDQAKSSSSPSPSPSSGENQRDPRVRSPEPGPERGTGRRRATGYDHQVLFARLRAEIFPEALTWAIPPDSGGKAGTFAERLTEDEQLDVVPTMLMFWQHVHDKDRDWTDERIHDNPAFALGCWRSRFTKLREEVHGTAPRNGGHTLPLYTGAPEPR
jgi:uncharacterized protein YdaU (DUF1376 family)